MGQGEGVRLRLTLASVFLPPWTARPVLREVAEATTGALDALLETYSPERLARIRAEENVRRGGLSARRQTMATAHRARVAALVDALGEAEGIRLARETLFPAGVRLGEAARQRLGTSDSPHDLVRAARVLYRVLGIRFHAEWHDERVAHVRIDRCALAAGYGDLTCRALSAADAGVVAGLFPGARFAFHERITEGRPACLARIELPRRDG
jgi:hypothetical protein